MNFFESTFYKHGLFTVLCCLLFACASPSPEIQQTAHQAYVSPCFAAATQQANRAKLQGYGAGTSWEEARAAALADIAQQLSVKVSSNSRGYEKLSEGERLDHFESRYQLSATATLENAVSICRDDQDPNGQIHTAYQVDLRLPLRILKDDLKARLAGQPPARYRFVGAKALIQSKVMRDLAERLSSFQARPIVTLETRLFRQHEQWYLQVGDAIVKVTEREFPLLLDWELEGSRPLLFAAFDKDSYRTQRLQQGDTFQLAVFTPVPCVVTLFNVYPDGRLAQLLPPVQSHIGELRLPNTPGATFEAATAQPGQASHDVLLAMCSEKPLDTLAFSRLHANQGMVESQASFNLDTFIDWLDQQPVTGMAALRLRIDP